MFYDFKCLNRDCKLFEEIQTIDCKLDERDSQVCPCCNKDILVRIYSAPAIKPANDCYKG